ncbi:DUF559 domain-containing protein [bacterium]|nr:DUF559 domain-containing protein [bacterium]
MNPYRSHLIKYARENRRSGNLSEALLWNELKGKKLGYRFTKQKPIGDYIADFYAKELNLVIEVDGWTHDDKYTYDRDRDAFMKSMGIHVVRVDDKDVKRDMNMVLAWIKTNIAMVVEPSPAAGAATPPSEGNF